MSGACFVTAVTPIGTFALSPTDKTKTLSDTNKDTISRICLLIVNIKSASACLLHRVLFAFRNFTGTVLTWHLTSWLSALRGIKRSYKACLLRM